MELMIQENHSLTLNGLLVIVCDDLEVLNKLRSRIDRKYNVHFLPERDLSERQQVDFGYTAARDCGATSIIFTRCNHLFSGIRLGIRKERPDLINQIVFIDDDEELFFLNVNKDGRISDWPQNFFDVAENTLIELL